MKSITYMFKPLIEEDGRINQRVVGINVMGSIDTVSNLHYRDSLKDFEGVNYYVDNVSVIQVSDIIKGGIINIALCIDSEMCIDKFGAKDDCYRAVENAVELIKNLVLEYGIDIMNVKSDVLGDKLPILQELVSRYTEIPIDFTRKSYNFSII